MNIKEAKQELLQTIQVYTRKDSNGNYLMPSVRQRPILLIGPPGIGKTAITVRIIMIMFPIIWNLFSSPVLICLLL